MDAKRFLKAIVVAATLMFAVPAGAQTVSSSDIQRLQDDVYQAGSDLSRMRGGDATATDRMREELDDLRDEVTYLKVKLRKEGSIDRRAYTELRDRIQAFRAQTRGDSQSSDAQQGRPGWSSSAPSGSGSGSTQRDVPVEERRRTSGRTTQNTPDRNIPEGQEIDVRLERALSSDTAQVEDRFDATTVVDMYEGNRVIIPAGSTMRGVVRSVDKASRTERKGSLTVAFDQVTVRGRDYPMRGVVTEAIESEGIKGEANRIGAGSAVGAIIGGILGGVKGAVLGVLIGGGGTIAATEGKDVNLPADTILRVRLETPPDIK
jgi:hypothetical protein